MSEGPRAVESERFFCGIMRTPRGKKPCPLNSNANMRERERGIWRLVHLRGYKNGSQWLPFIGTKYQLWFQCLIASDYIRNVFPSRFVQTSLLMLFGQTILKLMTNFKQIFNILPLLKIMCKN